MQCQSGKGGEQRHSLSAGHLVKPIAFPWRLLLTTGRGSPGLDGHGLNQTSVTAVSPTATARRRQLQGMFLPFLFCQENTEVHHQVRRRYQTYSHLNYHLFTLAWHEGGGLGQNCGMDARNGRSIEKPYKQPSASDIVLSIIKAIEKCEVLPWSRSKSPLCL